MNATRNKVKERNKQLNSQLQAQVDAAEIRMNKSMIDAKLSEILLNAANLILGGVVIGGLFQDSDYSLEMIILGAISYFLIVYWGMNKYKKSIKK